MGRRGVGGSGGRFWGSGQKRGLSTSFQAEIAQEIETLIGSQAVAQIDLEALETAARRCALRLAARALERQLNQDHSDEAGPWQSCACGARARLAGRRAKTFQSVLGALTIKRAYYHCSACGTGWFPRDRSLALENSFLSPAVTRMIGTVGAKQVERTAEALGADIAGDEKQHVAPLDDLPLPPTLYLGLDGTGIPMRPSELKGRTGKQLDGSAKTREVKLCTVWSAEGRDENGTPVRDQGSVTYSAAIETAATLDTDKQRAPFTERVLREATRRRFTQAACIVVLGDGAPWIWRIAKELFPRATQIVDRFHVKQHLSELSKLLCPHNPEQAKAWAQRRHEELDSGRLPDLLRALRRHADRSEEARKCFQYIHSNRLRMRYPQFHAQGLCTSSGVVEAGCKVAIGTRLKRAGMHWTVTGSNAIIALRCARLSGRFQDYWERRADQRAA